MRVLSSMSICLAAAASIQKVDCRLGAPNKLASVGFGSFSPAGEGGAKLVATLQAKKTITDLHVEKGRMICDTLDEATGADKLKITLTSRDAVIADKSSYVPWDNHIFTDRLPRNVWTGNVRSESGYEGYPRTISVTWIGCDVESFQVTMVSPTKNGGQNVIVSRPAHDGTGDFFILRFHRKRSDEHEAADRRNLRRGLVRTGFDAKMPSGQVLDKSRVVDLLVVYTAKAKSADARLSSSQMETEIITAYQVANDGLAASGVRFTIRVVHMEQVAYEEGSSVDAVYDLRSSNNFGTDIDAMRDRYGADLVQLIGLFDDVCGIAFTMGNPATASDRHAFSVVSADCLSNLSHIHEIGHNLGANHDRMNASGITKYGHAYRKCDGDEPFRTIMAYEAGCSAAPRVNVFSTPHRKYDGQVQGTDELNNVRVLNDAMETVVNFRERKVPYGTLTPPPATPEPVAHSIYPEALPLKSMAEVGCYSDDPANRAMTAGTRMPEVIGVTAGMTRENCLAYCFNHANAYSFFGLQAGDECFCDHDLRGMHVREIDPLHCNIECAGNNNDTCGGENALEVLEIVGLAA